MSIPKSLTSGAIRGLAWLSTGAVAEAVVQVATLILLARLIAPDAFGVAAAAMVVIGLLQVVSQLGVESAIVQKKALKDADICAAFTLALGLGALFAAVVYLLAGSIARLFSVSELKAVLEQLAVLFLLVGIGSTSESLLLRDMRYRAIAVMGTVSHFVGFSIVGVCLALLGFGVHALVWAYLVQAGCRSVLALSFRRVTLVGPFKFADAIGLLRFGAGWTIGKIGNAIAQQGDNFIVGRWLGPEALGLYSRAYAFLMLPTRLLGTAVDKVLFASMATIQGDTERLRRSVQRATVLTMYCSLPCSAFLFLISPELISVLLGTLWADLVPIFQVLSVVLVFRIGYKVSESLARSVGAVYRRAWRQWAYAFAVCLMAYIGQYFGVFGVAVGVAVAITVNYALMLQLASSLVGVSLREICIEKLRCVCMTCAGFILPYLVTEVARSADQHDILVIGIASLSTLGVGMAFFVVRKWWAPDDLIWGIESVLRTALGSRRRNRVEDSGEV